MPEVIVYYSLQHMGNFGALPSPVNRRSEKEIAETEAKQTIKLTLGDLQIVVFVCDDKVTDPEIYEQTNLLKRAVIGLVPGFQQSEYTENEDGDGFVKDIPEADWVDESDDEL